MARPEVSLELKPRDRSVSYTLSVPTAPFDDAAFAAAVPAGLRAYIAAVTADLARLEAAGSRAGALEREAYTACVHAALTCERLRARAEQERRAQATLVGRLAPAQASRLAQLRAQASAGGADAGMAALLAARLGERGVSLGGDTAGARAEQAADYALAATLLAATPWSDAARLRSIEIAVELGDTSSAEAAIDEGLARGAPTLLATLHLWRARLAADRDPSLAEALPHVDAALAALTDPVSRLAPLTLQALARYRAREFVPALTAALAVLEAGSAPELGAAAESSERQVALRVACDAIERLDLTLGRLPSGFDKALVSVLGALAVRHAYRGDVERAGLFARAAVERAHDQPGQAHDALRVQARLARDAGRADESARLEAAAQPVRAPALFGILGMISEITLESEEAKVVFAAGEPADPAPARDAPTGSVHVEERFEGGDPEAAEAGRASSPEDPATDDVDGAAPPVPEATRRAIDSLARLCVEPDSWRLRSGSPPALHLTARVFAAPTPVAVEVEGAADATSDLAECLREMVPRALAHETHSVVAELRLDDLDRRDSPWGDSIGAAFGAGDLGALGGMIGTGESLGMGGLGLRGAGVGGGGTAEGLGGLGTRGRGSGGAVMGRGRGQVGVSTKPSPPPPRKPRPKRAAKP